MKKALLITSILALLLIGAEPNPKGLVRLTLINKSGMKIAVQLQSTDDDLLVYYLPVPEGDKENPAIKIYTIVRDAYHMQLHYIETYDPVYGFKCFQQPPNQLVAFRHMRVVFLECGQTPVNWGEPTQMKYLPVSYAAIPGTSIARKMVITQCAPLAVQFGLIRKCWQYRFIY